jgi:general secretion pathway protein L
MAILQIYIPEQGVPSDIPLAELPRGERVDAILPAALVLTTEIKLPPARGQKLRQLLPFAVEERLLTDPEAIHAAAGPRQLSGLTPVVVVDKAWLTAVIDALEKVGLRPDRILSELCLPELEPEAWTLVWSGSDGFVRTSAHVGLALDSGVDDLPPFALARALEDARIAGNPPDRILLRPTGDGRVPDLARWSEALGVTVARGQDWEWAPRFVNLDGAINLLQGDLTPFASLRELIPRLKPVWAMALLILGVQVLATSVDWWMLTQQKKALTTEMEKSFRQAFPDAKIVVDPSLQMERKLADLRHSSGQLDTNDFLPLLSSAVDLLQRTPGGKLQALRYDGGELKLDLTLADEGALETLRNALKDQKHTKLEASTPQAGKVTARIAIGGAS